MKKELLIFGADGDLGKGVSKILVQKDFDHIFLFGRSKTKILTESGNAEFIQTGDLSIEKNVEEVFSKVKPAKNKLLFLFSTIGGYAGGKNLWEIEQNDWEFMFRLNVEINFLIAKHFALVVKGCSGGSVCFTSAVTSLKAENQKSSYGASKSALNYLVQTLAKEGKAINLSANTIAPFILDIEENREWVKDKSSLVKLEEIGELVYNIFSNFKIVSGNIIQLPYTIKV